MKEYKISEEVRQGLINYLKGKPWEEVNDGVVLLMQLEELTKRGRPKKNAGSGKTK